MNATIGTMAVGSVVLSFLGVELIRRWASRNLLDVPNERSSHSVPTPRGGGLAIAVVLFTGLGALQALFRFFPPRQFAAYIVGCALVVVVSWIDDLRGVANRWRLLTHTVAAVVVVAAFGPLTRIEIGSIPLKTELLGWLLTITWIVGLTNAFNFMDGIDGIASVQAIVAGAGWCLIGPAPARWVALLLAASTIGFLLHNWPPARIFLGDVGSTLLGFVIASLPLLGGRSPQTFEWSAFLMVWPFLFDTAFTLIRRWRRGENVFAAHRAHLYQRLVIHGLSQSAVITVYGALAVAGVLLGWETAKHRVSDAVPLLAVSMLGLGLWLLTLSREQSLDRH